MEYINVEEAIDRPGLRLVLSAGVPGPWGEAAKYLLRYKGLEFTPVRQEGGGENPALRAWTGQNSAPVLVCDDLPPACHWLDLLMLAERLRPEPSLLGADDSERIQVIGLSALVVGADGFGWNRRMHMLAPLLAMDPPPEPIVRLGQKYGFSEQALAAATGRLQSICKLLDDTLARQQAAGRDYLVGAGVTAVDFYWAAFAALLKPLGPADCPMPDYMRNSYGTSDEATRACLTPRLEAHRDFMYQRHIGLPMDF